MSRECKEGNHREDDEGGISVKDLQRGDISEIQSREEREEEGRNNPNEGGDDEADGHGQERLSSAINTEYCTKVTN